MYGNEYINHILDQLSFLGGIRIKRMFGGYGIYRHEIFFALVIDNHIYFKVNHNNHQDYEAYESHPFTYERNGKLVALSYWQVPIDILEQRELLLRWAQEAIKAAQQNKTRKRKPE